MTRSVVSITFVTADGQERCVDAVAGLSLMENALAHGIGAIDAICGGNAYCGTCRVYVAAQWRDAVGDATEIEQPMIDATADYTPGVRLSCQIVVTPGMEGLIVATPETQS